jgi:tetratricopeptide (TPR) repeat protein
MKPARLVLSLTFVFITSILFTAQTSSQAELDLGLGAYKQARFEEATQHFQRAIALQPDNAVAHLYLANAYAAEYIPGVDSPANVHVGEAAISEYQAVLQTDPQSLEAIKGVAGLNLQMKKFEDAKRFYRKAIEVKAEDPEDYYSIGVIDWTEAYTERMVQRAKLNLKLDKPFIHSGECWVVRSDNEEVVEEAIENLSKAIELRHDYDDAMAYMNLMYRERADIQCENPLGYKSDLEAADHWVDLAMSTKKAKAAQYDRHPEDQATPSN